MQAHMLHVRDFKLYLMLSGCCSSDFLKLDYLLTNSASLILQGEKTSEQWGRIGSAS